jgi:hypothetical protein
MREPRPHQPSGSTRLESAVSTHWSTPMDTAYTFPISGLPKRPRGLNSMKTMSTPKTITF